MINRMQAEKATKIYIPKVTNPQILTYRKAEPEMKAEQESVMSVAENNIDSEKRR